MARQFHAVLPAVLVLCAAFPGAQAPNVVTHETTVTATVDQIDRGSRLLNLRGDNNQFLTVSVDPSLKEFESLQRGDTVTVRYVESVIVQVRPNAPLSEPRDTTEDAKKAGRSHIVGQHKAVVTIEEIDPQGLFVTYRTAGGMRGVRAVIDKRLLNGLHVGDRIEVTLTRERAVSLERRK